MNKIWLKKNIKTILIIVAISIVLWFVAMYFKRNMKPKFDNMGNRIFTEQELRSAFKKVADNYGPDFAKKTEQLFRKETAHFTSGQFKKTLSPGMEIAGGTNSTQTVFPYGWSSLRNFIQQNPQYNGNFYVHRMNENQTGFSKTFIGWPTLEGSVMFVAWFIKNVRNGRFGYWYSLNESLASSYENNMSKITARYV